MSPEQGQGDAVDQRSDIYSLGVVFFEMLTGAKPYDGEAAMSVIIQHREAPVPRLPGALRAIPAGDRADAGQEAGGAVPVRGGNPRLAAGVRRVPT